MTDLRTLSLEQLAQRRGHSLEHHVVDGELRRRDEAMKNLYVALKEIVEHPAAFSDGASRLWTQARSALAALEAPAQKSKAAKDERKRFADAEEDRP